MTCVDAYATTKCPLVPAESVSTPKEWKISARSSLFPFAYARLKQLTHSLAQNPMASEYGLGPRVTCSCFIM